MIKNIYGKYCRGGNASEFSRAWTPCRTNLQSEGTSLFQRSLFGQIMLLSLASQKILHPVVCFPLKYLFICNSLILIITASFFHASLHVFSSWKMLSLLPHFESLHWLNSTLLGVQKPCLDSGGTTQHFIFLKHSSNFLCSSVSCHILVSVCVKAIP